jgi:DNA repair exonuclease SbcCD ATPase subunit
VLAVAAMSRLDDFEADIARHLRCAFACERKIADLERRLADERLELARWRALAANREEDREKLVKLLAEPRARRVSAEIVRAKDAPAPDRLGLQAPAGPCFMKPLEEYRDEHVGQ